MDIDRIIKKTGKKIFFFQKDFLRDVEIRENKQKSSQKKPFSHVDTTQWILCQILVIPVI